MKESNDILVLFESLNNHEVFTPPRLAKQMLELFPDDVWTHPEYKFLDPCVKSGVFLREMFYKLFEGLEGKGKFAADDGITYDLNDNRQRINHIFKNMLYGIATSELTGYVSRRTLYGVMEADSDKQLSAIESFERSKNFRDWTEQQKLDFVGRNQFNDYFDHTIFKTKEYEGFEKEGNIFYPNNEVKQIVAEEGNFIIEDTYFPFIDDRTKHRKILDIKEQKMKFDVIIGNPPYQISDGGHGRSAAPIYHKFVQHAKSMKPRYLTMIIPARWFAGGKGLDDFRSEMLNDSRIRHLVDYENSNDVFPGVDVAGGICYFLWDRDNAGLCEVTNFNKVNKTKSSRALNEFPVFIRHSQAIPIIRKVLGANENNGKRLSETVSASKPFGIRGHYQPKSSGTPCYFTQRQGVLYVDPKDITDSNKLLHKYKLLVPRAPIAGQTDFSKPVKFYYDGNVRIAGPGEACTESWIVAFSSDAIDQVVNFKTYLFTKTVRFLLLQTVISQDVTRQNFIFIPDLGRYDKTFTDKDLIDRWSITEEEWKFIDSKIKTIDPSDGGLNDE